MPEQHFGVIPIRRRASISEADELIADFAYALWHSSPFRCGPPPGTSFHDRFANAEREICGGAVLGAKTQERPPSDCSHEKPVGLRVKMNNPLVLEDVSICCSLATACVLDVPVEATDAHQEFTIFSDRVIDLF